MTGAVNVDSVLKHLAFRENRARSANTRRANLPVSIALKSDQAWDKLVSGVVDARKKYLRAYKIKGIWKLSFC